MNCYISMVSFTMYDTLFGHVYIGFPHTKLHLPLYSPIVTTPVTELEVESYLCKSGFVRRRVTELEALYRFFRESSEWAFELVLLYNGNPYLLFSLKIIKSRTGSVLMD